MDDLTVYLRGGQLITVRVDKCTWRRDLITGGLADLVTRLDPRPDTPVKPW